MQEITLEEAKKQTEQRTLCSKCFVKSENNWLRQKIISLKRQPEVQTGERHRIWDNEMIKKVRELQSQLSKLRKTTTAELMTENENLKKQLSDLEFKFNQQLNKVNDELVKCKNLIINSKFSAPSITQKEELLKMTVDDLVNLQPQIKEETKEEVKETEEGVNDDKLIELFQREDLTPEEMFSEYVTLTNRTSKSSFYRDKTKFS